MTDDDTVKADKPKERAAAARLVDMARSLYDLGVGDDGSTPFGLQPDIPHIALPLRDGKFGLRANLSWRFFDKYDTVPSQQALADALTTLEGLARQGEPRRVHLRVARHAETVYIDLADADDRVIAVTNNTWTITDSAPVVFRRTELTAPIPAPIRGGDLQRLWEFINVAALDRPIVLAFMVAALIQPDVPHTILGFLAEHGSAKSTTTRYVVSLTDPSRVPLRMPPRDIDQWITGANGSWVVAIDNLSTISDWLSDALCRAATGDGNIKRQLYTDSGLSVIHIRRCVIINGIDLGGLNTDLTDRLALADLERITEDDRRDETELEADWLKAYPAIFGGLLDLAAQVHAKLPTITVDKLPRMADFAKVLAAIDEINDSEGLKRYRERASHLAADSVASDPFIARLQELHYDCTDRTAAQILAAVTPMERGWRPPQGWPKKSRAATTQLTRHAPALRTLGWHIENDNGQNKANATRWTIRYVGGASESEASYGDFPNSPKKGAPTCESEAASQAGDKYGPSLDGTADICGVSPPSSSHRTTSREGVFPDSPSSPTVSLQVNGHKSGELEIGPLTRLPPGSASAAATRDAANVAYLNGQCRDCHERPHSAGRPRCDECHRNYLRVMAGYDQ